MVDKCICDCGTTEPGAIQVCLACYNEKAVKVDKARRALSQINFMSASKFLGKTNEDILHEIQLLSFELLDFLRKPMEIE